MIFGVGNQKGGVTKSTTALTLAHILHQEGGDVAFIDFDAPNSLRKAGNGISQTIAQGLGIKTYTPDNLPETVTGHLVLDLPPDAADESLNLAINVADGIIVPTRLDEQDILVTNSYTNLLKERGANFKVLIAMVHPNSSSTAKQMANELSNHVDVFKNYTKYYSVYRDAVSSGGTVAGINTREGRRALNDHLAILHEVRTWLSGR